MSPPRRAVITSIPTRLVRTVQGNENAGPGYQDHCIASWIKAGFDVVSLNSSDEVALLTSRHPDVTFVTATRDGRAQWQAPLVFVADLVACLHARGYAFGGIINADVFPMRDAAYFDALEALCRGGAAYGQRVDVSDLSSTAEAAFYEYGYDYVFFDVAAAQAIAPGEHLLGMVWWDLWLPMALKWAGLKLHRLFSPTVFHLKHPERTEGRFDTLWRHFYRHTVDCVGRELARSDDPLLIELFAPSRAFEHAANWESEALSFGKAAQEYLHRAAAPVTL